MSIKNNKCLSADGNIKVICRFRPLNDDEIENGAESIIKLPNEGEENCISIAAKSYSFDKVLHSDASQDRVYTVAAEPLVSDLLDGYNGTLFAYGQTSSGKTYSMEGIIGDSVEQGIIPRAVNEIFDRIRSKGMEFEFLVKVSYYEIYMEKIHDLLDASKINLQIHEDRNRKPYVKDITERCVSSPQDIFDIIEAGRLNRHISMTNMNEYSSRSHSVFTINVHRKNLIDQRQLSGTLYFLDLAGSEKVSKTGADGVVLNEAKIINKSLSALGNVISALADEQQTHIPYRDSKLTRILQDSLGGNARTAILLCCSPASTSECETKSTFEFGHRAKIIKNVAYTHRKFSAENWKALYKTNKEKNTYFEILIRRLQDELIRWRNGDLVGIDEQVIFEESTDNSSLECKNSPTDNAFSPLSSLSYMSNATYLEGGDETAYDKTKEIADRSQCLENRKQQLLKQENIIKKMRVENNALKLELDFAKEEVKVLMEALEELAFNYDEKCADAYTKDENIKELSKRLQCIQNTQNACLMKMENLNNMKKNIDTMFNRFSNGLMDVTENLSGEHSSSDTGTKSATSLSEMANERKSKYCGSDILNAKSPLDHGYVSSLHRSDDSLQKANNQQHQSVENGNDLFNKFHTDLNAIEQMVRDISNEAKENVNDLERKTVLESRMKCLCDVNLDRSKPSTSNCMDNEFLQLQQIMITNQQIQRTRKDLKYLENSLTQQLEMFYTNMKNRSNIADEKNKSGEIFIEHLHQHNTLQLNVTMQGIKYLKETNDKNAPGN
uniref:Kinesin motor domain-containing protein n=1 Tax=Glossina austeni TaxID=7395 RepID=A0A1A9UTW3_GLOAU